MFSLRGLFRTIFGPHTDPLPTPIPPPSPVSPPAPPPVPQPNTPMSALLEAHNAERAKVGLKPLTLNIILGTVSATWATWMARNENMNHDAGGYTFVGRIQSSGYKYSGAGENIAEGQPDVTTVMTAWMNSPGHRANILGDFTEIGFAMVPDVKGIPYWCVDFGKPLTPENILVGKEYHTPGGVHHHRL
jgi:uncharacterized protein YkwD